MTAATTKRGDADTSTREPGSSEAAIAVAARQARAVARPEVEVGGLDRKEAAAKAALEAGRPEDAMALMVEGFSEPLLRFCTGILGDPRAAEEVVQESYVAAWNALPRFRGEARLKTWLYAIARRRCIDQHRRRARVLPFADPENGRSNHEPPAPTPESLAGDAQDARHLRACLGELEPAKRAVVLLRFEQGMSFPEIAEVIGEAPDTAKRRVYRALNSLRICLASRGVER